MDVTGLEGNPMDAWDGVPLLLVRVKVPHNVFFQFRADPEEELSLISVHPKHFSCLVGKDSVCLGQRHAAFAHHVRVGC